MSSLAVIIGIIITIIGLALTYAEPTAVRLLGLVACILGLTLGYAGLYRATKVKRCPTHTRNKNPED